jgi:hypothetical protein
MSNLSLIAEPKIEENTIEKNFNSEDINSCFSLLPELKECDLNIIAQPKSLNDELPVEEFIFSFDQYARENYIMARDCGTYEYERFCRDFPDEDPLVKCPTCEEMIYCDDQHGMCYTCFDIEQKLYPDDIPMELRYNN